MGSFSYRSCTILSLLLLLSSLQRVLASKRREKRLGSSLTSSKEQDETTLESFLQQETSVAWGRLLEGTDSNSMSMMPELSPTPRPPPPSPTMPAPTPRPPSQTTTPPSPTPPPSQGRTLLALGDSLCAGQLPEPPFTIFFSDDAYVDTLYQHLQENHDFDTLLKVCCPGENSFEFINAIENPPISDGSFCYPDEESSIATQLEAMVTALESNDEIGLISISLGANDIFRCGLDPDPQACVTTQLQQLVVNLQTILSTIVESSDDPIPMIAMTPYNANLALYLSDVQEEQALVPVSILAITGLQTAATQVYNAFNVPVIGGNDVFGGLDNSTTPEGIPQNVANICRYTGMCDETEAGYVLNPSETRDIHATPEGYEVLGKAHFDVVDELLL